MLNNEILKVIKERRNIHRYKKEQIKDEKLQAVLEAGLYAPTTTEVMLVNWLKHNLKSNKKAVELINKELIDVKDKELLKKLYDYCSRRHCSVKELFNGVIVPGLEDAEEAWEGTPVAAWSFSRDFATASTVPYTADVQPSALNIITKQKSQILLISVTNFIVLLCLSWVYYLLYTSLP